MMIDVDSLANEIRRVDGSHSLGAGTLAEALMPFIAAHLSQPQPVAQGEAVAWQKRIYLAPDRQDEGGWTEWFECSQGFAESVLKHQPNGRFQDVELRPLYATPAGHRVVPVEPTEAMIADGCSMHVCEQGDSYYRSEDLSDVDCVAIYKAMLAAAPAAGGV